MSEVGIRGPKSKVNCHPDGFIIHTEPQGGDGEDTQPGTGLLGGDSKEAGTGFCIRCIVHEELHRRFNSWGVP